MFFTPKAAGRTVRVTAGLIIPKERTVLMIQGHDRTAPGVYWRPPGGDALYGVYSQEAVLRTASEQLGAALAGIRYVATLESLYRLEGRKRHEVMLLFAGRLADADAYDVDAWTVRDEAGDASRGGWIDLAAPPADHAILPAGLPETVARHWDRIAGPAGD